MWHNHCKWLLSVIMLTHTNDITGILMVYLFTFGKYATKTILLFNDSILLGKTNFINSLRYSPAYEIAMITTAPT